MCGDPACKYITLIEDEDGGRQAIHYGYSENDNLYYILWTDYWKPEGSENKQFRSHIWRPVNRTRKHRSKSQRHNKTQKIFKNRVVRLGKVVQLFG